MGPVRNTRIPQTRLAIATPLVFGRLPPVGVISGVLYGFIFLSVDVKEHATLSAGANVDHGVKVETTGAHVNRAADRGCVSRLVRLNSFILRLAAGRHPIRSYSTVCA